MEEIFPWSARLSGSSKLFVLCAVGEPEKVKTRTRKPGACATRRRPSHFSALVIGAERACLNVSGNHNSTYPATSKTNTNGLSASVRASILASFGMVILQPVPIGDIKVGIILARIAACSLSATSSTSPKAPSSSHSPSILVRLLDPLVPEGFRTTRYLPAPITKRRQSIESSPFN